MKKMDQLPKAQEEKLTTTLQQKEQLQNQHNYQNHQQSQQPHSQQQNVQLQHLSTHQLQTLLAFRNRASNNAGVDEKSASSEVASSTLQTESNLFLEELAQVISDNLRADMTTPPSSSHIYSSRNETGVTSIRDQTKMVKTATPEGSPGSQSSNAVQQSQVSSSNPTFLPNEVLGALLLKALNGFIFVVNSQGKVEFISENVTQFLKYTQEDLVGKSIYNIIHVGDHPQFSKNLLPMTYITSSGLAWPIDSLSSRGNNFNCRMLVKHPSEEEEDVELKQTYVSQYKNMQITTSYQPSLTQRLSDSQPLSPQSQENRSCLLFIAQLNEKNNMMMAAGSQFSNTESLQGKTLRAENREWEQNVGLKGVDSSNVLSSIIDQSRNTPTTSTAPLLSLPSMTTNVDTGMSRFDTNNTDDIFADLDFLAGMQNNNQDMKPPTVAGTTSSRGHTWSSDTAMKSPKTSSTPSPLQFALHNGSGTHSETSKRPAILSRSQRSSSTNSNEDCQKSPRFTPSPGNAPPSAGYNQKTLIAHLNKRGLTIPPIGSSSGLQQSQTPKQLALNVQGRSSAVPMISPQSGLSPAGQSSSPVVTSLPSVVGDFTQSGTLPGNMQHLSSLGTFQLINPVSQSGMTSLSGNTAERAQLGLSGGTSQLRIAAGSSQKGAISGKFQPVMTGRLNINVTSPTPFSGFPNSTLYSKSLPSYSASMKLNSTQNNIGNLAASSNNSGLSSQRLCQLLTQPSNPESQLTPTTGNGRRQISGRVRQPSGQITSSPSPNQVLTLSGGTANLTMESHRPGSIQRVIKSPDDHLHQSPTEGPGQSPQEKPQSTSSVDGDIESTNQSIIDNSNFLFQSVGGVGISSSNINSNNNSNNDSNNNNGSSGRNYILKNLLSTEDDDDEPTLDQGQISPLTTSVPGGHSADLLSIKGRNDAEPQMNALLKQLLGEQRQQTKQLQPRELNEKIKREIAVFTSRSPPVASSSSGLSTTTASITTTTAAAAATKKRKLSTGRELLLHLLHESDDEGDNDYKAKSRIITSAPAESTSADLDPDGTSRHHSENPEPQSTTNSLPMSESYILAGNMDKRKHSVNDTRRGPVDDLLQTLWMQDSKKSQIHQVPASSSSNVKRQRMSSSEIDSSDVAYIDVEPNTVPNVPPRPKSLSETNALLVQLLSKKAQMKNVSNTKVPIDPTGIPQNRYKDINLINKVVNIKPAKNDVSASPATSCTPTDNKQGITSLPKVARLDIGQNSGISDSPSLSIYNSNISNFPSSSFSDGQASMDTESSLDIASTESQLKLFQRLLDEENVFLNSGSHMGDSVSKLGQSNLTENDRLLQEILQQAADLQEDLHKNMGGTSETGQGSLFGGSLPGTEAGNGLGSNFSANSVSSLTSVAQASVSVHQPTMQRQLNQEQHRLQERFNLLPNQQLLKQQQSLRPLLQTSQQHPQQLFLSTPKQSSSTSTIILKPLEANSWVQQSQATLPQQSFTSSPSSLISSPMSAASSLSHQQQPVLASDEESNLVAQLEEFFKETGNWPNLENYVPDVNLSQQSQSSEELVIDGIKRQLMDDDPLILQQQQTVEGIVDSGTLDSKQSIQHLHGRINLYQQQQLQQQQQFNQTTRGPSQIIGYKINARDVQQGMSVSLSTGSTSSTDPPASTLKTGPNTSTLNRQMLLSQQQPQQQTDKQDIKQQRRFLQIQQQQQHLQRLSPSLTQRVNQTNLPTTGSQSISQVTFPENLRELMTQGLPPNVTLPVQRGQAMPGPMSPHFIIPTTQTSQLSPNFPPQPRSGGAWLLRAQAPADPLGLQGSQFSPNLSQQRTLPSPGGGPQQQPQNRVQIVETSQLTNNAGVRNSHGEGTRQLAGLFSTSQDQQQQLQQGGQGLFRGRMMQRMSTGTGSPVAVTRPYSSSPLDPLLISPQAGMSPNTTLKSSLQAGMSPNTNMRHTSQSNIQISAQLNQISTSVGNRNLTVSLSGNPGASQGGPSASPGASSFNSDRCMSESTASALQEFDLQLLDTTLRSMENRNLSNENGISSVGTSTSDYVKQELRNICNARSEKQQQQQPQMMAPLEFDSSSSELPPDILETINDMSREHGGPLSNLSDEAETLSQMRLEARQFKPLSKSGHTAGSTPEDAEIKATGLFRNQLLGPGQNTSVPVSNSLKLLVQSISKGGNMSQFNVLQTGDQSPGEEIKQADNKNSLLCQLLSE